MSPAPSSPREDSATNGGRMPRRVFVLSAAAASGLVLSDALGTIAPTPAEAAVAWTHPFTFRAHVSAGYKTPSRPTHVGVDYSSPPVRGADIHPVAPGTVTYNAANHTSWGHYIEITHKDGYLSRYAHMTAGTGAATGTVVAPCDVIGQVGSTGNATGPHLHLEITKDGRYANIDPGPLIDDAPLPTGCEDTEDTEDDPMPSSERKSYAGAQPLTKGTWTRVLLSNATERRFASTTSNLKREAGQIVFTLQFSGGTKGDAIAQVRVLHETLDTSGAVTATTRTQISEIQATSGSSFGQHTSVYDDAARTNSYLEVVAMQANVTLTKVEYAKLYWVS